MCADNVSTLGGSVHTIKKNTESLEVASKEFGLEVNSDKTTYVATSRDQSSGRGHDIKTDNSSFEKVEEFKYLGKTLAYQDSIKEEIKTEVRECLLSFGVEFLSSGLLSKKIKIKIYRTIILPFVLYGSATWSLTLSEERRLRFLDIRLLGRILGPKRDEATGEQRKIT